MVLLCRRRLTPMSLLSLQMASGQRVFSVLSLAWGFVADVDIESEKFRRLGAIRFTVGTLLRLATLRVYRGRLAYLPAGRAASSRPASPARGLLASSRPPSPARDPRAASRSPSPALGPRAASRSASPPRGPQGPVDTHLVPLGEPVPAHWTVVPEQDFVLVLIMLHSHLGSEMFVAPMAHGTGVMHLFYVRAGVTRAMLLRLFLAMEKGRHMEFDCPYLEYVPVVAFRLEPRDAKGMFAVDGEFVVSECVQGQVHPEYLWMVGQPSPLPELPVPPPSQPPPPQTPPSQTPPPEGPV